MLGGKLILYGDVKAKANIREGILVVVNRGPSWDIMLFPPSTPGPLVSILASSSLLKVEEVELEEQVFTGSGSVFLNTEIGVEVVFPW